MVLKTKFARVRTSWNISMLSSSKSMLLMSFCLRNMKVQELFQFIIDNLSSCRSINFFSSKKKINALVKVGRRTRAKHQNQKETSKQIHLIMLWFRHVDVDVDDELFGPNQTEWGWLGMYRQHQLTETEHFWTWLIVYNCA